MHFPANCKYTEDHEWIRIEDGRIASVGITDFAQSELGELVYIEVETVGESLEAHAVFGAVEAVKTTSDLLLPVSGKILEFNPDLDDSKGGDPGLVNSDPYGKGWIVKIEVADPAALNALMDDAAYKAYLGK